MGQTIMIAVNNCARCGGRHRPIAFRRLKNPPDDYAWWALCPANGQPILLKVAG